MMWYIHSRMWMILTSIVPGAAATLKSPKTVKLKSLVPLSEHVFKQGEFVTITLKRSSRKESSGYDSPPVIDVTFDPKAIATLGRTLFPASSFLHLRELLFRFTDYGFLNVFSVFQVMKEMDVSHLDDETIRLDEQFNKSKEYVGFVIKYLKESSLIEQPETDELGVPPYFSQSDLFSSEDNYLNASHLLLINKSPATQAQVKEAFSCIAEPISFDDAEVFLSNNPVWIVSKRPTVEEMLYFLSADNLYLAESAYYYACTNWYQAVLAGSVIDARPRPRRRLSFKSASRVMKRLRRDKRRSANVLSSVDLRYLLMRNNVVLHKIIVCRKYLNSPQLEYLSSYKSFSPLSEDYAFYRTAEELLKFIVHDKEEEERERANTAIESILFIFTALTVYSVVTDVVSFLKQDSDLPELNLHSPKVRLMILVTGVLLLVYFLLHRYRKRHWR